MIDYQRLFHVGVRVPDLDQAMAELGETLSVTWATAQHYRAMTVWTPAGGTQTFDLQFTYSSEGPQHLELLQGEVGSPWDGSGEPGVHHLGVWVDDVVIETERCRSLGWDLVAAGAAPGDGYGAFTYLAPPSGAIVELVSGAVRPVFERWWAGGSLGADRDES